MIDNIKLEITHKEMTDVPCILEEDNAVALEVIDQIIAESPHVTCGGYNM